MDAEGACEVISTTMRPVAICGRRDWTIVMPEHRAARVEWPWWEWPRLASMHANLSFGDVLYDVGTEEGDQSALYQCWVGEGPARRLYEALNIPTGGVVLIEPNPAVWANVKAIWDANDLARPIGTMVGFATHPMPPQAIGEVRGMSMGWPDCADGPMIGDHGFSNVAERPDIDRITLDRLAIETRPPDAITIDTEGSELLVLQSAAHILTQYRPLVWVSIHPEFSRDMYGVTRDDLIDYMHDLDYRYEHLAAEHELHTFFYPAEPCRAVTLPYGRPGCGG